MKNNLELNKENENGRMSGKKKMLILAVAGFSVAAIVALFYLYLARNQIYIENASIEAIPITLSSRSVGVLENVLVKPGDLVARDQIVAQVGQELIKTKESGEIISTNDEPGKNFNPGEAVVTMIQRESLRVVARVDEDKELADIRVGQKVFFTADTFGSKEFSGVVDEISPTFRDSDVVFNISSQREVKQFNVKIRFDALQYPEIKNGMSAKVWIYKD